MKRAIALTGSGPAVGLSIGSLKRIHEEADIRFDVWALAGIGAWLGAVWNQAEPGREAEASAEFFRGIFRPDAVYDKFPFAAPFAPDFEALLRNAAEFVLDPQSYANLVVPDAIQEAWSEILRYFSDPRQWSPGNFNKLLLNQVLAVNPWSRFMTAWIYKSKARGLSRISDDVFLDRIDISKLYEPDRPVLYHNAYNLSDGRLELFSNRDAKYSNITAQTLCACSALPYIDEPVVIDGKTYCQGAAVDTANFEDLLRNHPDLDEVWVSRILDIKQVRKPDNLYDALNNLVMLFSAVTGEDDVKLFKHHIATHHPHVKVVEIPVAHNANYDWSHSNLHRLMDEGYDAADAVISAYRQGRKLSHVEAERMNEAAGPRRQHKISASIQSSEIVGSPGYSDPFPKK